MQKTHDKLFIPCTERRGSGYFEFQFYKKDRPVQKAAQDYHQHWLPDSLCVHIDHQDVFMRHYLPYLRETNAPNGSHEFCYFAPNYYTKEQTAEMLEQIRADRPLEWEMLIPWLEKASTEYYGFFLMGV
ncbi:MAG: hypothetical protein IJX47_02535 [Clostridia bacterium]|nr:hypothetical protein [Clostridia bacterium]